MGGAAMRYINKKDKRVAIQEETCTCGHSREEHRESDGECCATEAESSRPCECTRYEPLEEEVIPVL